MKLGMNHPMGPLALADLIGLDTCLAILEVLHDGIGDPKYRPCPLLKTYVAAGCLGCKMSRVFFADELDRLLNGLGANTTHRRAALDPEGRARFRHRGNRPVHRE